MTNFKTIIVAAFGSILLLSACGGGETVEEVVQREVELQMQATPDTEPDYSQSECAGINTEDTSIYVPEDWNAWCEGYKAVEDIWGGMSSGEQTELCTEFWMIPDAELLQEGMLEWGMTRDQTIGFIDYLWLTC